MSEQQTEKPPATPRQKTLLAVGTGAVLAALTAGSWLMIEGSVSFSWLSNGGLPEGENCPAHELAPVTAERVTVNIYNSTNEPGLANEVAEDLTERNFRVDEVDNDYYADTGFEGIIRVGESGLRQAYTLQQHLPGTLVDVDSRGGFSVDLVIGSDYSGLEDADEVLKEPGRLACTGE